MKSKVKPSGKSATLDLLSFKGPYMRSFHITWIHITWMAFFLCFFGWFGVTPLMTVVREELHLTKSQIGNIITSSVMITIFARSLGGFAGDKAGIRWGLRGRVYFLFIVLFLEGLSLMLFSRISMLPLAIGSMVVFSLFVQMAEGATFSVVPFVNKKAVGTISGIVGAGGNAGAVAAGFLFKAEGISYQQGLFILGAAVTTISLVTFFVRFSKDAEEVEKAELKDYLKIKDEPSLADVEPAFAYSKSHDSITNK